MKCAAGQRTTKILISTLVLSLLALFACKKRSAHKTPEPDSVLGSRLSIAYDKDFASEVDQIVPLKGGSTLVSGVTRPSVKDDESGFIHKIAEDGTVQFALVSSKRGSFAGIASHDSGELTALEFIEVQDFENLYRLDIVRYDVEGKSVKITSLDLLADQLFDSVGECHDKSPVFVTARSVAVFAEGDDVVISLIACSQYVAFRLSAKHDLVWTRKLTPNLELQALGGTCIMQSLKHAGKLVVAFELADEAATAAAKHLSIDMISTSPKNVLFMIFLELSSGEIKNAERLKDEFEGFPSAFAARDDRLYLVAAKARDNPSQASKKKSDLYLHAFKLSDLSTIWQQTYDFKDEHLPKAAAVTESDELIVGGAFGHIVVDTGSWGAYPDAFLGVFSTKDGSLIGGKVLHTDRYDGVNSLALINDSEIIYGGDTNGPITHTADSDPTLAYVHGFVETIELSSLLGGEIKYGGE